MDILLVEDSEINRQLLTRQIERFGYSPQAAASGEQALDYASKKRFDLVLLDVNLDGMSGIETCRRLREMELVETRETPLYIAAITANADPKQQVECLSAGMNDCLGKPISSRALEDLFQSVYGQISGQADYATDRAPAEDRGGSQGTKVDTLDSERFANLLDLTDSEKFVLNQLFEMFQRSIEQNIVRLRSALSLEDSVVAAKAAHAIKSSSVEIGAARIAQNAAHAEDQARAGETQELWGFVNSLPFLVERFGERFEKAVNEISD